MIGRKAVVICKATNKKIMIQTFTPASDLASVLANPCFRKRTPNTVATRQKTRCSAPIQASDSVDCEKIHATGAKPTSSIVISISNPANKPQTSNSRAREPLKQVKI